MPYDTDLEDIADAMWGREQASARSKAQYRFLQGIAHGKMAPGKSTLSPEDAQNMVAPPEDPLSGQPFTKYYRMLPETAKEGPDPFEDYNRQIMEIMRQRRQGF